MRKIILITNESCNLDRTYCYEKHKFKNRMTFEKAKNIIDKEMVLTATDEKLAVEFIGG